MSARFIIGDTRKVLASLPDASVDLVLSSPPFLALRSYLPADHPDKALEIGSEATPGEFIDTLLDVVEECARVLTPHGTLAFELGDTYSGSGGAGGDYTDTGLRAGQEKFSGSALQHRLGAQRNRDLTDWPLEKSLCLIPESFRWALVYGRNPFTGRETPRWRARNVVRWCRPNPPVGALGDKFRPATSEMVIVCKSRTRWFDLDAVRTEHKRDPETISLRHGVDEVPERNMNHGRDGFVNSGNAGGAPPLDWWEIPTQGYAGSHYATFPERLVTRPIEAMCPTFVCRQCGEPRRRIVGEATYERTDSDRVPARLTMLDGERPAEGVNQHTRDDGANTSVPRNAPTLGWTDCGHDDYRRGITLDPFGGSGTTSAVAEGLGRDSILIDLDARNTDLARERCGMFLTVEEFVTELAS